MTTTVSAPRPPLRHRLRWMVPSLVRGGEYGAIMLIVGDHWATLALLSVLAMHHYDLVYRPRALGNDVPRWVRVVMLGPAARVVALGLAAFGGVATTVAAVMAALFGVTVTAEAATSFVRARQQRR